MSNTDGDRAELQGRTSQSDRFRGSGPPYGPPRDPLEPHPRHCRECGSFMRWVCKHREIQQAMDEAEETGEEYQPPPGPWGYWRCVNCRGPDPDKAAYDREVPQEDLAE